MDRSRSGFETLKDVGGEPRMVEVEVIFKWKPSRLVNETITTAACIHPYDYPINKEEIEFYANHCAKLIWQQIVAIKEKYYVEEEQNEKA